jgi:hypothetical protein
MAFDWRGPARWLGWASGTPRADTGATTPVADTAIYFHEDDYCQTQLLPLSAWAHCAKQLAEIHRFAEAHRADGDGYTDIFVRKEGPTALADLRLAYAELDRLLSARLPCHRLVTTGYGSVADPVPRVVAYGAGQLGCVFVHYDEAGIVQEVFTQFLLMQPTEIEQMHGALSDLAHTADLLLVDWPHGALLRLADGDALRTYLSQALAIDAH